MFYCISTKIEKYDDLIKNFSLIEKNDILESLNPQLFK